MNNTKEDHIKSIQSLAQAILTFKIEEEIIKENSYNTPQFRFLREYTPMLQTYLPELIKLDLSRMVPTPIAEELYISLREMYDVLVRMKEAVSKLGVDPRATSTTEPEFKRAFSVHFNNFTKITNQIFFAVEYFTSKKEFEVQAKVLLAKMEELVKTGEEKVASLTKLTEKTGLAKYSNLYTEMADKQEKSAKEWKGWGLMIIIATMLVAIGFISIQIGELTTNFEIVQYVITKVIILTCLFLVIALCLKNYRINKHNALINRNRSNALITYDALDKNSKEPAQKELMRAVTNTIFGNVPTGYNTSNKHESDLASKILDKFKLS